MFCLDSDNREAITLRIFVKGMSVYDDGEVEAGSLEPVSSRFDTIEATSDLRIRPCGPVPEMEEMSIPFSFAIILATGEIKMRPVTGPGEAVDGLDSAGCCHHDIHRGGG